MRNIGRDRARKLLTAVVLDFDDVRDGFKPGSFEALLDRACQIIGEHSAIRAEAKAKFILGRARAAAIANGLHGDDPVQPAQAALVVLRPAFEGRPGR